MATFYNTLGSSTFPGTDLQDTIFAFTSDNNLDHILADGTLSSLLWTTNIRNADGTPFTIQASNIQFSTDVFFGGLRSDVLYGSKANDLIVYNDGMFKNGFGGFDSVEQFWLSEGDDIVDLSAQAGGIDYAISAFITAGAGNDVVIGGAGLDTIEGDAGGDLLFGYRGSDVIRGGIGDDVIYGDDLGYNGIAGEDNLRGDAGNDTLFGGAKADRLEGGEGNELLYGGKGHDVLDGGTGDDLLVGDEVGIAGDDKLTGGEGNDQLFGGDGTDNLSGGTGSDLLHGGKGYDVLIGATEADIFMFDFGDTSLNTATFDVVFDFATGIDHIDLDIFSGSAGNGYAELSIATSSFKDALAAATGAMGAGTEAVFVAGATNGWLIWDGDGNATLDQAIVLRGQNTLGSFDSFDLV